MQSPVRCRLEQKTEDVHLPSFLGPSIGFPPEPVDVIKWLPACKYHTVAYILMMLHLLCTYHIPSLDMWKEILVFMGPNITKMLILG